MPPDGKVAKFNGVGQVVRRPNLLVTVFGHVGVRHSESLYLRRRGRWPTTGSPLLAMCLYLSSSLGRAGGRRPTTVIREFGHVVRWPSVLFWPCTYSFTCPWIPGSDQCQPSLSRCETTPRLFLARLRVRSDIPAIVAAICKLAEVCGPADSWAASQA